jgi:hypothetical protein
MTDAVQNATSARDGQRVAVNASLHFFDCVAFLSGTQSDTSRAGARSNDSSPAAPVLRVVHIAARALIDPDSDWQFAETYGAWSNVTWCVPGPENGPFAAHGGWAPRDTGKPPRAVPCRIEFVRDDDPERGVRWDQSKGELVAPASRGEHGWGSEYRTGWPTDATGAPFPGIAEIQQYDVAGQYDRTGRERRITGTPLPFILNLNERGGVTLNADALDSITLTLAPAQFDSLAGLVGAGQLFVGTWDGLVRLTRDTRSLVVLSSSLNFSTACRREVAERRFEHELGMVYRSARRVWANDLPPAERWGASGLHTTLRGILPGLARQALRQRWDDTSRDAGLRSALQIVEASRLGLRLAAKPGRAWDAESDLAAKARAVHAAAGDPTSDCWALYTLGFGDLDPLSIHALAGLTSADVADVALPYERAQWLWNPELTQALVYASVATETGMFLSSAVGGLADRQMIVAPDLTQVVLKPPPPSLADAPALKSLAGLQRRQRRRKGFNTAVLRMASVWWAGALGAVIGYAIGGRLSAVAGFFAASWIAALSDERRDRDHEDQPIPRMKRAMLQACLDAGAPLIDWATLHRSMAKAATHGAVWSPEAVRLVNRGRRRQQRGRT